MRNPVMNEKSAEEWEQIKNFVGAASEKTRKHPLERELERREGQPQHLADGGDVLNALQQPQQPVGAPPAPAAPLMPPAAVPAPPASAGAPMDANLNKQASDIMGGVTPETITRLMESLNQQGRRGQIGAGIAGIGDAIQSVAGIKGDHMKNAEDMIEKNREFALKVPGEMAAIGKERYGLTKELGGDEPTSMRSFTAQKANEPLLTQMGFTPEQIKAMPSSLIDGIRSGAIDREKALAQIAAETGFKNAQLGIESATAQNTAENNKIQRAQEDQRLKAAADKQGADESDAATRRQIEAGKELEGRPWYIKAKDVVAPSESTKLMRGIVSGQDGSALTPDVISYAKTHGITPEQALAIKQKRGGK